ncbi:MAG TPA: GAF domain-containing protein [Stellaceae bacterium]|nr:GAF domain-containing protein [Stellaceae bacterium]
MTQDASPLRYFGIVPESMEAKLLRFVLETAVASIGGEEGSLLVYDPKANDLTWAMTVGSEEAEKKLLGTRLPMGAGITGLAAATHEVQVGAPIYHDIEQTKRKSSDPEAVVAAPMLTDEKLIGVITTVSFESGRRFSAKEANICGRFAKIAAVIVEQHQKITAADDRALLATSGKDTETNARLQEIDASLKNIVEHHPAALAQVSAIVASLELALGRPKR